MKPDFTPTLEQAGLPPSTITELSTLAATTADPAAVFEQLGQLISTCVNDPARHTLITNLLTDPVWRRRLVLVLGNSFYLGHVIQRWPGFLEEVATTGLDADPVELNRELLERGARITHRQELERELRLFRHREYLRIGIGDLSGESPVEEVTRRLTLVAEGTLEAGYRWLDRWLQSQHGRPLVTTPEGNLQPARFVVLGMGKLGGHELNFSSDIDLIYLYDFDNGTTDGARKVDIKSYFIRLGRELAKLLHDLTAEGTVFRVDLRLRPEGESGDLCISCRSAETYYESWGRTWERAAMIKARPVAGDLALGAEFLRNLTPFVYRRYLDFGALEDLRQLKLKIDHKTAADYRRNVKLGYGGIREIEFFVQCQQLIHGGKHPRLRRLGTLANLRELVGIGFVSQGDGEFLEGAYRFLRTVEHRLQVERAQQTHTLPEEPAALERLARRMGMASAAGFMQRLRQVTDGVNAIFQDLFHDSSGEATASLAINCDPESRECREQLTRAGFQEPDKGVELLRILRDGPPRTPLVESDRRWYQRLAPRLMQEILAAPDQDMALHHAGVFLTKIGRRVNYLALLVENPQVLRLLVRLFGTSPYLSRHLNHHLQLLDHLVSFDFLEHFRTKSELNRDLAALAATADEREHRLELMVEFKNTEVLRLGIRDLSGLADLGEVMTGLAGLADAILTQVMVDAMEDLNRRHGIPMWVDGGGTRHKAEFAILAMGKLGGGELNYASDLDLMFVHGSTGEEQWTTGAHPISNGIYFTKLGQKIITTITSLSGAGKLYEVDMRLRPSGKSGPLVTSFAAFAKYQEESAWTWEHQALIRSRVVVGDFELVKQLKECIEAVITRPRTLEPLRREVAEMRERMFHEKAPPAEVVDIKQSRGGIVDIEFLAQFLILAHAHAIPKIYQRNLGNALNAFHKAGLLDSEQAAILDEAYRFYRMVENRLRLLHDRYENQIGPDPLIKLRLGRLCGLPPREGITELLHGHFARVLPIYQRFLGEEGG